jgi:hypothetical protein
MYTKKQVWHLGSALFLLCLVFVVLSKQSPIGGVIAHKNTVLYNSTLLIPCASRAHGDGNLVLPSGVRIHALRNAAFSLAVSLHCVLKVVFQSESRKDWAETYSLGEEKEATLAQSNEWLWQEGTAKAPNIYYAIDTLYDTAFIHWILESAVFLSYWAEVKTLFPSTKLVLRRPRNFKTLFFPVFGVDPEDVVYNTGGWDAMNFPGSEGFPPPGPDTFPTPNFFLAPPGQYLHDTSLNMILFKQTLESFAGKALLYSSSGANLSSRGGRKVLVLPRGKKENNAGPNDRVIPELDSLAEMIESEGMTGAEVLRTDDIKDISQQINAVAQAKVIFVAAGSAAYFNMLFAVNATIYILGPDRHNMDMGRWPYSRAVWDFGGRLNRLVIRDDTISNDVLSTLLRDAVLFA